MLVLILGLSHRRCVGHSVYKDILIMLNQSSLFRKELYQLELEYCGQHKRDDIKAGQLREKISALMLRNCQGWGGLSRIEMQSIFDIYGSISLSSQTLGKLINLSADDLNDISPSSFGEAINYVGGITGLDLSNVKEVRLDRYDCAYTEGECVACNQDNHHVYYSLDSNQVSSVDLLCHEIGHAADFTYARQAPGGDETLYRHQSITEAVAHYCQFRYLRDHGNKYKRTGALGSFVYTYLTYLLCCYCFENKKHLAEVDPAQAIDDVLFESFMAAYSLSYGVDPAKHFLAQKIHETQDRFQDLGSIILQELNPRLGIPLGLILLSIKNIELSRVSILNILSVELKQILRSIDQGFMEKFFDMDKLFSEFIE